MGVGILIETLDKQLEKLSWLVPLHYRRLSVVYSGHDLAVLIELLIKWEG